MGLKRKWKKNFREIPKGILEEIKKIGNKDFVIGCVKKISEDEITSGVYSHLGIEFNDRKLSYQPEIMPRPEIGRYSRRNVWGEEIVRRDLPMEQKTYSFEAPNYGDWSNGSHEVSWNRDVYKREFVPPKDLVINIELLGRDERSGKYIFKFMIDSVLQANQRNLKEEVFNDLNIVQENIGASDVFSADTTRSDFLKKIFVDWEILPLGKNDEETITRIISILKPKNDQERKQIIDRAKFLARQKPVHYIAGTSGFSRYFGAQFLDDMVVFENIEYGNAIYIMFDKWQELSKLSRIELLKIKKGFIRIPHIREWKKKVETVIRASQANTDK